MDEDFNIHQENESSAEKEFEKALRPLKFDDFSGEDKVVENLRIFVEAAKFRGEPLDHTLLHGPPGLGKTTLSNIIANELGVGFKVTSGPVLDKPGDLAGILTSLEPKDVLFIDESGVLRRQRVRPLLSLAIGWGAVSDGHPTRRRVGHDGEEVRPSSSLAREAAATEPGTPPEPAWCCSGS